MPDTPTKKLVGDILCAVTIVCLFLLALMT